VAGKTYRWTPERKAEVEAALRSSGTRKEAAAKLGVSMSALDFACDVYGFAPSALCTPAPTFARIAAPAPVDPGVPAWQGYRPRAGWAEPEKGPAPKHPKVETKRIAVLPDKHVKANDRKACAVARGIIKDFAPHRVVIIGDYMDMESLSHYPKRRPDITRLSEEYYEANVELDADQGAAPDAAWTYLEGNHEGWADKYAAIFGHLDGMLSVPQSLYIEPRSDYHREAANLRGMTWVPLGKQPVVLDGVGFLHGVFESKHHAAAHAENLGPSVGVRTLVAGHTHDFQSYTSAAGFQCFHCGFLGDPSSIAFAYTRGKPRPWRHGLLLIEVTGELVTVTQVPILNGRAVLSGRVVEAA
jgi:predicted phosphodiesterase